MEVFTACLSFIPFLAALISRINSVFGKGIQLLALWKGLGFLSYLATCLVLGMMNPFIFCIAKIV